MTNQRELQRAPLFEGSERAPLFEGSERAPVFHKPLQYYNEYRQVQCQHKSSFQGNDGGKLASISVTQTFLYVLDSMTLNFFNEVLVVDIWIKARFHCVRMLVFLDFSFSFSYYLFVIS